MPRIESRAGAAAPRPVLHRPAIITLTVWLTATLLAGLAAAADTEPPAMFGNTPSRNMVSAETGLPGEWDAKSGKNVKWTAQLGSQTYAGPVAHGGQVYVGTNNEALRNPDLGGDRGVVMAFAAGDGELLWQAAHAKLPAGPVNDWPMQGVCSTPFVDGDRLYYVSNQAHVIAADTQGFRDAENDGPYGDEQAGTPIDEDVVWRLDMIGELDVFPHNMAAGNPLVVDGVLYTVTGNGVDESHVVLPSPFAPSFLAIDAASGELLWESNHPGENILHGTWSNPAYGVIGGRAQVIFPGGDGWLYSFEPKTGELLWKFDANPKGSVWQLGGAGTRNNIIASPVIHDGRVYIGVGQDPEHGEGEGHFYALDPTGSGDVTDTAVIWHRGGEDFHRTISTAAIHDGIVYIPDFSGFLYALDADTGELHWTYDAFAAIWGSAFVADGKVYLGDEDGDVAVLKAGKTMELLGEHNMGSAVYTTPTARAGTLYIATRTTLFALEEGAGAAKSAE